MTQVGKLNLTFQIRRSVHRLVPRHIAYILALSHSPLKKPRDTLEPLLAPTLDATSSSLLSVSAGFVSFTPPTNMPWVKSMPPTELALSIQDLVSAESVPIWTPSQDVSLAEGEKNVTLEAALDWAANLDKHRWDDRGEEEVQQLVVVAGSLYLVADFYRLLDSFDPKSL